MCAHNGNAGVNRCCTSHQVFDHLGQHFHHGDVSDASQSQGGGGEDEVSGQDGLEDGTKRIIYIF